MLTFGVQFSFCAKVRLILRLHFRRSPKQIPCNPKNHSCPGHTQRIRALAVPRESTCRSFRGPAKIKWNLQRQPLPRQSIWTSWSGRPPRKGERLISKPTCLSDLSQIWQNKVNESVRMYFQLNERVKLTFVWNFVPSFAFCLCLILVWIYFLPIS